MNTSKDLAGNKVLSKGAKEEIWSGLKLQLLVPFNPFPNKPWFLRVCCTIL